VEAMKNLKSNNSSAALFTAFKKTTIPVGSLKNQAVSACSSSYPAPPRDTPPPVSVSDSLPRRRGGLVSGRQAHLLPYFMFSQAPA